MLEKASLAKKIENGLVTKPLCFSVESREHAAGAQTGAPRPSRSTAPANKTYTRQCRPAGRSETKVDKNIVRRSNTRAIIHCKNCGLATSRQKLEKSRFKTYVFYHRKSSATRWRPHGSAATLTNHRACAQPETFFLNTAPKYRACQRK